MSEDNEQVEKVNQIIAENLGIDTNQISKGHSLAEDLFADSLDVARIVLGIEDEFEVDISVKKFETVSGIHKAVKEMVL